MNSRAAFGWPRSWAKCFYRKTENNKEEGWWWEQLGKGCQISQRGLGVLSSDSKRLERKPQTVKSLIVDPYQWLGHNLNHMCINCHYIWTFTGALCLQHDEVQIWLTALTSQFCRSTHHLVGLRNAALIPSICLSQGLAQQACGIWGASSSFPRRHSFSRFQTEVVRHQHQAPVYLQSQLAIQVYSTYRTQHISFGDFFSGFPLIST